MTTFKIYKIVADALDGTDRFLCYIGSTTDLLTTRLANHESLYKRYLHGKARNTRSYDVLCKGYYAIALVEDLGEVSSEEARIKEGQHIKQYQQDPDYIVVNKRVEGRQHQEYYQDNKKRFADYQRAYARRHETVACAICGKHYTRSNRARHFKAH